MKITIARKGFKKKILQLWRPVPGCYCINAFGFGIVISFIPSLPGNAGRKREGYDK